MVNWFNLKKIRQDILYIILIFLGWKVFLFLSYLCALKFIPLGYKDRFLGGGLINYQVSPGFFSWANFDGEHYLSISIFGYKGLEHAFFPVFPLLMNFVSSFILTVWQNFSNIDFMAVLVSAIFSGLLISNLAFLISLIVLYDLLRIDYSRKISLLTIILIAVFPTSFYFSAVYTESIFLLFSVLSFYFAKKNRWFWASLFGMIASATKIFGVLILFVLLIEIWQKKISPKKVIWIILIPSGLIAYMYYLWNTTGDPIMFYHLQKLVGEQHQSGITLLPQVYYRYLKILLTMNYTNPIYQTIILELFTGILFFLLPIYGFFRKIPLPYLFYAFISFIVPPMQGSFSSTPRYVLVLFPSFLALALFLDRVPVFLRNIIIIASAVLLFTEYGLFLRGYWIA